MNREEWLRAGTLLYTLEQDGWIKGKPAMRNRLMVRVEGHHTVPAEDVEALVVQLLDALSSLPLLEGWRPISEAKKDGQPVLLKLKDRIPRDRDDLRRWDGLQFVGRHSGLASDGFDIGWQFAAPVGQGGFPDDWFEGWTLLPSAPSLQGSVSGPEGRAS